MLGEVAWSPLEDTRIDTWVRTGTEVTHHYDSLLAKVMVHRPTREAAIAAMAEMIATTRVKGIPTNCQLLSAILAEAAFKSGAYTTHLIEGMTVEYRFMEVREVWVAG